MKAKTLLLLVLFCSALVSSAALGDETGPALAVNAKAPPAPVSEGAARWRVGAGVQATGLVGTLPTVALVVPVFLDLRREHRGLSTPAFRLAFARIDSGTLTSGAAIANLVWSTGRLDACPLFYRGAIFGFEPCARVSAGVIDASGSNIYHSQTTSRPWAEVGLVARARATFYDFFFVEVEVSAAATLTRDRFYFEPNRTISEASLITGSAGMGVGAFFF